MYVYFYVISLLKLMYICRQTVTPLSNVCFDGNEELTCPFKLWPMV